MAIKFELNTKVKIIPLDIPGVVISIWLTEMGIQYEVRYFWSGKAEKVYFFEDELEVDKTCQAK